jgi:hypothetical protein
MDSHVEQPSPEREQDDRENGEPNISFKHIEPPLLLRASDLEATQL